MLLTKKRTPSSYEIFYDGPLKQFDSSGRRQSSKPKSSKPQASSKSTRRSTSEQKIPPKTLQKPKRVSSISSSTVSSASNSTASNSSTVSAKDLFDMNDVLRNTLDALSRSTSSGEDRWERIRSQEESNEIKRKEQIISAAAGPIKKDEKKKAKKGKESENRVIEISGSEKSASEKSRSKKSQKSKSTSSKSAKSTQATGEKAIKPKQELKPTRTITVAQPPAKPQPLSRKPVNNSLDSLSTIPSSYQVPPSSHEQKPVKAPKVVAKPKLNATQLAQRKDAGK